MWIYTNSKRGTMKINIKDIFRRKLSDEAKAILTLNENIKTVQAHLIALARLNFTNPERFAEEARNHKANGEYILKMLNKKEVKKDE